MIRCSARFFTPCALLALGVQAAHGQYRCGIAKDLVVQALENVRTQPSRQQIADNIQLFKQALQTCPTLGDAYYYRSLFETQIGNAGAAQFAMTQANILRSEALAAHIDPFHLAAPEKSAPALGPVREKWALVIGIGTFRNKIKGLEFTRGDAQDLKTALLDPNVGRFADDHVRLLTDSEATTSGIKAGLNWIARSADPGDLVLIFIASHGTSRNRDGVGGLNYILTNDTDEKDQDTLFGSAVSMVEVSNIVRSRIKALRTVVFLDTCYSGGAGDALIHAAAPTKDALQSIVAGAGRVIISSSSENQQSYESGTLGNGLFTYYLLGALRQSKGEWPISKIFESVAAGVSRHAKDEFHAVQTPVMTRSESGAEIVIGAGASPTELKVSGG